MINKTENITNRKEGFRNDIISVFRKANFKIYSELLWGDFEKSIYPATPAWFGFEQRAFPVIAAVHYEHIENLYRLLQKNRFQDVTLIDTPEFYIIHFTNCNRLPGVVISPKERFMSLDCYVLNQSRDAKILYQLQAAGERAAIYDLANIDFISARILWVLEDMVCADHLNMEGTGYQIAKYNNSHEEYLKLFHGFQNPWKSGVGNQYYWPMGAQYDHVATFARIYYWIVRIMAEAIKGSELVLHDVGTQFAHLPLLLNCLSPQDLMGLKLKKILASDMNVVGAFFAEHYLKTNQIKPNIQFIQTDFSQGIPAAMDSDVTVIIDVLEHLYDDRTSLEILGKFWKRTRKLLIARVPFEDVANPGWDHFIAFNPAKLSQWATKIPGAHCLSNSFQETDGRSLMEYGFLILKRDTD
jgi:hypothetical protein